ncbi:MarR family transcriptional regulator [Leuconostoc mesenteroides]|uniref:MarR family transcriptional regulator n=1 Tax=Leuconostoc mesenteroides TaxID=1245 RepID=UPI000A581E7B|nr:helix-turn-helix domain-containing protein [Leuconostoc mesenteroides]
MTSIGKLFKIGQRNLVRDLDTLAVTHGGIGAQLSTIDFIAYNKYVTQKDIEQEFHIKASSVATMIDRMVEKKWLQECQMKKIKELMKYNSRHQEQRLIKSLNKLLAPIMKIFYGLFLKVNEKL